MKMSMFLFSVLFVSFFAAAQQQGFDGSWSMIAEKSTEMSTWRGRSLRLDIATAGDAMTLIHNWIERNQVAYADSFIFHPGGGSVTSVVNSQIWPDNWFMGVLSRPGAMKTFRGSWQVPSTALRVVTKHPIRTSQGDATVTTTRDYVLSPDGGTLTLTEQRNARPTPVVIVFQRTPSPAK